MQIIQNQHGVYGHWRPSSSCQAAPGSPGLASAAGRNWTQERTDQDLYQDCRQDNEQGPLQKAAMDEDSETLAIPQLQTEYDVHGTEHRVDQCRVTCPVRPSQV